MKYAVRPLVAVVLAVAASLSLAETLPRRLWPVSLDPAVSSNFCEYRDGRFHAGVDIRTYGREGVACRAVDDGWVTRIRASSRGYGKALHLTLDSGDRVVYAHLAEFAPELEDTLRAAQRAAGSYAVDFRPPDGRFRVQRGDVIAYSGQTGATAPHLHFETRSPEDDAVNPFLRGFDLPDRLRPVFSRVAFIPLSPESRVEGRCFPIELVPREAAAGRYTVDDTLRFAGDVGAAVGVHDRLNAASGRLAPYSMEVWADDSLRTRVSMERFAFARSGEVDLLYHAGALRSRGTTLFQLYEREGQSVPGRWFERGGRLGAPGADAGVHRGRIVAKDVAGNLAELQFHYILATSHPQQPEPRGRRSRAADLALDLGGAFFADDFAVLPPLGAPGDADPSAVASTDAPGDTVVLRAAELADSIRPVVRGSETVYVTGLRRGEARSVDFRDLGVTLGVGRGAVYTDVVVFATRAGAAGVRAGRGLELRTQPVRLGPAGWVLRGGIDIHIDIADPTEGDAVFRYDDRRRSWSFLASTRDSTGLAARSDRPGVFAVLRDTAGPWLGAPSAVAVQSYGTQVSHAEVRVPVEDVGSGLDDARIDVTVAGAARIAYWDFARKKIVVDLRDETIIGPQPVHVSVYDRVGNQSVAEATVDFGPR